MCAPPPLGPLLDGGSSLGRGRLAYPDAGLLAERSWQPRACCLGPGVQQVAPVLHQSPLLRRPFLCFTCSLTLWCWEQSGPLPGVEHHWAPRWFSGCWVEPGAAVGVLHTRAQVCGGLGPWQGCASGPLTETCLRGALAALPSRDAGPQHQFLDGAGPGGRRLVAVSG